MKKCFSRFCEITRLYKPKLIIRICADNTFMDSSEIDKLVKFEKITKKIYTHLITYLTKTMIILMV